LRRREGPHRRPGRAAPQLGRRERRRRRRRLRPHGGGDGADAGPLGGGERRGQGRTGRHAGGVHGRRPRGHGRPAAAHPRRARLVLPAVALPVLARPDAFVPTHVDTVRSSRFTYLAGGSPMHLRSVLKETPLWDAIVEAVEAGGVVAGSSAGAMVLTDPMVDP